jgi:hypothetical protein
LQSYQELCCNMSLKYTSFTGFGFSPRELWCSDWWTRRTFPSRHFFNGEEILREKGNGTVLCSPTTAGLWQGMPRPGKKRKKNYKILFVLNNELT